MCWGYSHGQRGVRREWRGSGERVNGGRAWAQLAGYGRLPIIIWLVNIIARVPRLLHTRRRPVLLDIPLQPAASGGDAGGARRGARERRRPACAADAAWCGALGRRQGRRVILARWLLRVVGLRVLAAIAAMAAVLQLLDLFEVSTRIIERGQGVTGVLTYAAALVGSSSSLATASKSGLRL